MKNLALPTFSQLSDEYEPSTLYYKGWETGLLRPSRHWCYLAEVVMENYHPFRPSALVKDARGFQHPIVFYLDNDDQQNTYNLQHSLKEGCTIALLYAEKKTFMDGSEGIRVEDPHVVRVFKCPLDVLSEELNKSVSKACCFTCQKNEKEVGENTNNNNNNNNTQEESLKLSRCARCIAALYCGKDCQVSHWQKVHKNLCADMKTIKNLQKLLTSPFRSCADFNALSK